MKNKRGISNVVSMVLILVLVMAAAVMVWNFVEDSLSDTMEETSSCHDARGKVTLENDQTCYNITNAETQIKFMVEIGDVNVDELLVSIQTNKQSETYKLTSDQTNVANLTTYPKDNQFVSVPGEESGQIYLATFPMIDLSTNEAGSLRISVTP